MGELRRKYGFWAAVGNLRMKELTAPEVVAGLVVGGGGGTYLILNASQELRHAVVGDFLPISGALLAVVFAAFALVIAFLSDEHLRRLETVRDGTEAFLRPFMISTGLQVGAVVGEIVYRAGATLVPWWVERTAFVLTSILLMTALFDVVALARTVLMHGVARGLAATESGGITPIEKGRRDQQRS